MKQDFRVMAEETKSPKMHKKKAGVVATAFRREMLPDAHPTILLSLEFLFIYSYL